jgi:oxaloacetate decarboxylase gamma subunit
LKQTFLFSSSQLVLYAEVYLMTIVEMLEQSAILTVLGMVVVFAFLWIMIICVRITGKAIRKLGLDKNVPQPPPPVTGTPPQVTAAICAAVKEYRDAGEQ